MKYLSPFLCIILISILYPIECNPTIALYTGQMSVFLSNPQCAQSNGPDIWLYINADGSQCVPYSDGSWYIQGSTKLQCAEPSNPDSTWQLQLYGDNQCGSSNAVIQGQGKSCVQVGNSATSGGTISNAYGTTYQLSDVSVSVDCEIYNSDRSINA